MSNTSRRERNLNYMEWDAVVAHGCFTPAEPVKWTHLSSRAAFHVGRIDQEMELSAGPDDDIATCRISKFDSVDELLASLKS